VTRTASRVPPQEQESATSPPWALCNLLGELFPKMPVAPFLHQCYSSRWEHGAPGTGTGTSLGGPRPLRQAGGSSETLSELWSRTGPV
jgi:hypothetical protein